MKRLVLMLFSIVGLVVADEVCEEKPFYSDKEKGWFFKVVCEKKKEEKKEEKKEKVVKIPWDKLDDLEPEEIQKIVKKAQDIAIMYPTKENVKEFQKLIIWLSNKSENFMYVAMDNMKQDPQLATYIAQRPTSTIGRTTRTAEILEEKSKLIKEFKDKAMLVVMVKQGCRYCEEQIRLLPIFQSNYNLDYKLFDINEYPYLAKNLQVQMTPDIFLVVEKEGKAQWIRIGTGLHTLYELRDAVVWGLYTAGLINIDRRDIY